MNAQIICVGTEILLGDIVNTNATEISHLLAEMGIGVYKQVVVGDNKERLKKALDENKPVDEIKKLGPELSGIYEKNEKDSDWEFRRVIKQLIQELTISADTLASLTPDSEICIGFDDVEAVEMEDGVLWALQQLEEAVPNVSMAILDRNENYVNYKYFSSAGKCELNNSDNEENFPKLDWIPNEWRELTFEEEFDYADMVLKGLQSYSYIPYSLTDKKKKEILSAIQEYIDEHDEEFSYYVPDGCNSYSNMGGIFEMDIYGAKDYLEQGRKDEEDD